MKLKYFGKRTLEDIIIEQTMKDFYFKQRK